MRGARRLILEGLRGGAAVTGVRVKVANIRVCGLDGRGE